MEIRRAIIEDASSIHSLTLQLGFGLSLTETAKQLEAILASPKDILLVVINQEKLIGFLHAIESTRLTSTPFTEIVALFVEQKERNKGIGSALLTELEENCQSSLIRVRCNSERVEAHAFYLSQAYRQLKEQKVFSKELTS